MNTYEKEAIGNIILIKNIVFSNHQKTKREIDHSWETGRPCIIIYSDENYDYFLPIKSSISQPKYQRHYIPLNEQELLYRQTKRLNDYNQKKYAKIETKGYINLETIYKIPISGHDEIGKITYEKYIEVINSIKEYQKGKNLEFILNDATIVKGR